MRPCLCQGENENCCRCNGSGYLPDSDTVIQVERERAARDAAKVLNIVEETFLVDGIEFEVVWNNHD